MKPSTEYSYCSVTLVRQFLVNNPAACPRCRAQRRRSGGRIGGKRYPWSMSPVCGDAKVRWVRQGVQQIREGAQGVTSGLLGILDSGGFRFDGLYFVTRRPLLMMERR